MPFKRSRRSSSVSDESISITDYNDDSIQSLSSTISTRKRRKTIDSRLEITHCQEILDKIRNAKAEDGHLISDSFIRLPNKRTASDYYDVIDTPIDIIKIQSRIKNDEYDAFYDFQLDVEQLVENAKTYHSSSSLEYQDASLLWNAFEQEKRNIAIKADVKAESSIEGRSRRGRKRIAISIDDGMSEQISLTTSDDSRNTSEISSNNSENPLEAYFTSVVTQRTDDGKDLSLTFTLLPSKHVCPQYLDIIKDPIDLRILAKLTSSLIKSQIGENQDELGIVRNPVNLQESRGLKVSLRSILLSTYAERDRLIRDYINHLHTIDLRKFSIDNEMRVITTSIAERKNLIKKFLRRWTEDIKEDIDETFTVIEQTFLQRAEQSVLDTVKLEENLAHMNQTLARFPLCLPCDQFEQMGARLLQWRQDSHILMSSNMNNPGILLRKQAMPNIKTAQTNIKEHVPMIIQWRVERSFDSGLRVEVTYWVVVSPRQGLNGDHWIVLETFEHRKFLLSLQYNSIFSTRKTWSGWPIFVKQF